LCFYKTIYLKFFYFYDYLLFLWLIKNANVNDDKFTIGSVKNIFIDIEWQKKTINHTNSRCNNENG